MDQIDTIQYHDFTINERYLNNDFIINLVNDMRDMRAELFRKQYIQLRKFFITFSLKSHDRYCLNILRIITLLYRLYIEHEIYHMAYNKIGNLLNKN